MSAGSTTLSVSKVLLIVNPKSGTGSKRAHIKAISIVKSTLNDAGISDVVSRETSAPHHATEIILEYAETLRDFSAIIVMGGDGTLHEVINGLISVAAKINQIDSSTEQNDEALTSKQRRLLPPVAPVPMGTGNAIAVSMNLGSVKRAALNVVHGLQSDASTPVCILRYRTLSLDGKTSIEEKQEAVSEKEVVGDYISICGVQWGLPAQVDQGTEWMRFAGDARLTIGALAHICTKRDYSARIVINIEPEQQEKATTEIRRMQKEAIAKKGDNKNKTYEEFQLEDDDVGYTNNDHICKKTGENEYTLDGRFVMLVAWNCQAIASDFAMTPLARMSEINVFDVLLIPSRNMNRIQLLNVMTHAEDGSFLSTSGHLVKYFKATRMRVERLEGEFLTVDGESVPVEPFVLEVAGESGTIDMFDTMSAPSVDRP